MGYETSTLPPQDPAAKPAAPFKGLALTVRDHYGKALHQYLMRRLRGTHHVRDLEQEVYLRLLRVASAELVRDPQAYMYRIASHVVYEFKQRAAQERVTFDSEAVADWEERPQDVSSDPLADQLSAERELQRALSSLQPQWRAAFILHMRDGLTHAEVAQRLKISAHTVKKHMFRAFLAMRSATQARERQG
ncbi:RNA polymerase sigma factor [Steroidobacter sp.]|uniref:RNA polymerase sigma factor n=1 Tax=Steroidobacter sp. TaxID=1978227 RepID=UPI001A425957|nr:RNA polymerase sigma factor [Steroidobacter sp.]MBL8271489.1 RNA polymerase sigma factor [Steroidobacter sp.]